MIPFTSPVKNKYDLKVFLPPVVPEQDNFNRFGYRPGNLGCVFDPDTDCIVGSWEVIQVFSMYLFV